MNNKFLYILTRVLMICVLLLLLSSPIIYKLIIGGGGGGITPPFITRGYDGIDVSHHNGAIRWNKVARNSNIKFVYVKATEGRSLKDNMFYQNTIDARRAGMNVGAYLFVNSYSSAMDHFLFFKNTVRGTNFNLIPMIDLEQSGIHGKSMGQIRDLVIELCSLLKSEYGKRPIIYTTYKIYNEIKCPEIDRQYIWICKYGSKPELVNDSKYQIWQYSEKGKIDGIKGYVDLNKFMNGMTIDKLKLR